MYHSHNSPGEPDVPETLGFETELTNEELSFEEPEGCVLSSVVENSILENRSSTKKESVLKTRSHHDSFAQYLQEISKTPLLTADEEKMLARKMLAGDTSAREQMIDANLRLVPWVARRYADWGLSLDDLVQEGNIGLMKAVEKFDPERGFRFCTYATWWIRQSITRAIANFEKTIRLPIHIVKKAQEYFRAQNTLEIKLGRTPTAQETADYLGVKDVRVLHKMRAMLWKSDTLFLEDLGIGIDRDDKNTGNWERTISNDNMPTPEELCFADSEKESLNTLLANLNAKERAIIELRFGVNCDKEHTLQEIGDTFGVTRERVRQIEAKVLKKLRKKASLV